MNFEETVLVAIEAAERNDLSSALNYARKARTLAEEEDELKAILLLARLEHFLEEARERVANKQPVVRQTGIEVNRVADSSHSLYRMSSLALICAAVAVWVGVLCQVNPAKIRALLATGLVGMVAALLWWRRARVAERIGL